MIKVKEKKSKSSLFFLTRKKLRDQKVTKRCCLIEIRNMKNKENIKKSMF